MSANCLTAVINRLFLYIEQDSYSTSLSAATVPERIATAGCIWRAGPEARPPVRDTRTARLFPELRKTTMPSRMSYTDHTIDLHMSENNSNFASDFE